MKARTEAVSQSHQAREQTQELIGILTAISIVSKRLAGRLMALERRRLIRDEGGGRP
jgi:hypothetical protein